MTRTMSLTQSAEDSGFQSVIYFFPMCSFAYCFVNRHLSVGPVDAVAFSRGSVEASNQDSRILLKTV